MLLKIGELAKRTGLTVRTLHHYDDIKLLRPSGRSPAGYRLYDRKDVERLHRIQALRRLDISLADIATLLEGEGTELATIIDQQIAALDEQMTRAADLRQRLAALRDDLRSDKEPELDDWLATLAIMNFYDRFLTSEELERMRRHGNRDMAEFQSLRQSLRDRMEAGVAPGDPSVVLLGKRWIEISLQQMAGDARLMHKIDTLHRNEPDVHLATGIDAPLLAYITRATAEYRLSIYARHLDPIDYAAVRASFLAHYEKWPALLAEARDLHERGCDPHASEALDLAKRWIALFNASWGTDPRIHAQIHKVNQIETELMAGLGTEIGLVRKSIDYLKAQAPEDTQ